MEYGVYGDLIMLYPKPYSIYLRGTIGCRAILSSVKCLGPLRICGFVGPVNDKGNADKQDPYFLETPPKP